MQNTTNKVRQIMRIAAKCGVSSIRNGEYYSSIGSTWGFCIRANSEAVLGFECNTTYLRMDERQKRFSEFVSLGKTFDECLVFFTSTPTI